jgi:hypothetical protein
MTDESANVQMVPKWDEVGPELLALVKEANAMMRGPTYLFAEQQVIAGLKMGVSWPERATAAIAAATRNPTP